MRARFAAPRLGWRLVAWVFAAATLLAAIRMSLDSGITLDEGVHKRYGDEILAWFTSGFTDTRATTCDQRIYGGLFDLMGAGLNALQIIPLDTYRLLHVLSALFGLAAIWATWKLAALIGGAPAGFLAASFLALTPSFVGHALFNPKDIPFATGATLTLYASVCIVMERTVLSWKSALRAGLCVGIALAVRPGGMFLLAYPLAATCARLLVSSLRRAVLQPRRGARELLRSTCTSTLKLSAGMAVAWVVMIASWPWAQQQPFTRPLEAAHEAANYQWRNKVLFDGERVNSYELPWTYLPTWFGITIPELYLLALACCGACAYLLVRQRTVDARKALSVTLVASSLAVPLLGVFVARPIIYDAHRHFLFLFPPLAALAGLAVARVMTDARVAKLLRGAVLAAFGALAGVCAFDMHALHPYEYVYFNRIFGGLPAAQGRFETDYWGAANREAFLWVLENVPSMNPTRVGICYAAWQIEPLKAQVADAEGFKAAKRDKHAPIYIATTRDDCHASQTGRVIHSVDRQGVPLAFVFQR